MQLKLSLVLALGLSAALSTSLSAQSTKVGAITPRILESLRKSESKSPS